MKVTVIYPTLSLEFDGQQTMMLMSSICRLEVEGIARQWQMQLPTHQTLVRSLSWRLAMTAINPPYTLPPMQKTTASLWEL